MKHETKIKSPKEKTNILLSFVFLLLLVFGQQEIRHLQLALRVSLSVCRSRGGTLSDHKVVVAHKLLLCCRTWREKAEKAASVLAADVQGGG